MGIGKVAPEVSGGKGYRPSFLGRVEGKMDFLRKYLLRANSAALVISGGVLLHTLRSCGQKIILDEITSPTQLLKHSWSFLTGKDDFSRSGVINKIYQSFSQKNSAPSEDSSFFDILKSVKNAALRARTAIFTLPKKYDASCEKIEFQTIVCGLLLTTLIGLYISKPICTGIVKPAAKRLFASESSPASMKNNNPDPVITTKSGTKIILPRFEDAEK